MTTTSYAVLGLLCIKPWSAYELAQQVERGWRFTWPRARSGIYEEPKSLVEHGYATARTERRGERGRKTVYTVTVAGRRALREWLTLPSAEPRFESEAVLRTLFATEGTKDDLLNTLDALCAHVRATRADMAVQAADYLQTGGPFPERLHIIALIGRLNHGYVALIDEWARWARSEVETWPDTKIGPPTPHLQQLLQEHVIDITVRARDPRSDPR
jgi:PadR family transcriptional regulator, regulatory protein AphA